MSQLLCEANIIPVVWKNAFRCTETQTIFKYFLYCKLYHNYQWKYISLKGDKGFPIVSCGSPQFLFISGF